MSIRTNFSPISVRTLATTKKHQHTVNSGTYGCVYKPALRCSNKTRGKRNHVTKLMSKDDADEELGHYNNITRIDPQYHFHLKLSDVCAPNSADYKAMLRCDSERVQRFTYSKDRGREHLDLLVLKDGGVNLDEAEPVLKNMGPAQVELFLEECTRLMDGIVTVHAAGYCMSDIKPNNIVYKETTNRLNYIDFGTLCLHSEYVGLLEHYNDFTFFHNYPLESYYLLHNGRNMAGPSPQIQSQRGRSRSQSRGQRSRQSPTLNTSFAQVVGHIVRQNRRLNEQRVLKDFEDMRKKMRAVSYTDLVSWCVHRVDVYQLGLSMMRVLDVLPNVPAAQQRLLFKLFYDMMHPNVFKRILPEQAAARFRAIVDEITPPVPVATTCA